MTLLLHLFLIIFGSFLIWDLSTAWLVNKYKLDICYGPKGVGKTTLMHKYAFKYFKKKWKIACNLGDLDPELLRPIYGPDCPLIYNFPASDIGLFARAYEDLSVRSLLEKKYAKLNLDHYYLEPHTLIFIDEINLLWDNRDFIKFPDHAKEYFRLQRHYKHKIIAFSQSFDQDKKIRNLTDRIVLCKRIARLLVIGVAYQQFPVMTSARNPNGEEAHQPADDYKKARLLPLYSAYLPKWIKKFDSFKK